VATSNLDVFINCPFDSDYKEFFNGVLFSVFDCGFRPRCALEEQDASQNRLDKILDIIESCPFGIHDISRTELDPAHELPRFNMPFELGLFLGAKRFGVQKQRNKRCIVFDHERFRYQKFISDIAGQDITAHDNRTDRAIEAVRNWLNANHPNQKLVIPGGEAIYERYLGFQSDTEDMCELRNWNPDKLTYKDYTQLISKWIEMYPPS